MPHSRSESTEERLPSPTAARRSEEIYLRIDPGMYHYLKFILEGYDNLAVLSSHDGKNGIVRLLFATESRREVMQLLAASARKLAG